MWSNLGSFWFLNFLCRFIFLNSHGVSLEKKRSSSFRFWKAFVNIEWWLWWPDWYQNVIACATFPCSNIRIHTLIIEQIAHSIIYRLQDTIDAKSLLEFTRTLSDGQLQHLHQITHSRSKSVEQCKCLWNHLYNWENFVKRLKTRKKNGKR